MLVGDVSTSIQCSVIHSLQFSLNSLRYIAAPFITSQMADGVVETVYMFVQMSVNGKLSCCSIYFSGGHRTLQCN